MTFRFTGIKVLAAAAAGAALALAAPIPAKPAPPTLGQWLVGQRYVAIPLQRLPTAHQLVRVAINGRPALFVLDSGAAGTVIDSNQLDRFGIGGSVLNGTGVGAGGAIKVSLHNVATFSIGGHRIPLGKIVSTDLTGVIAGFGKVPDGSISGVVGQDVLTRFGGVIDVKGNALYLKIP